jgi:2-polyprenyl-3-methyl-5-hydroxy-6-metoxy-1,4-benzoquinol methylase
MLAKKRSGIAHGSLPFHSPYSTETIDKIIDIFQLPPLSLSAPAARILDLGCGKGQMLLRCLRTGGGDAMRKGYGVDHDQERINELTSTARASNLNVEAWCMDLTEWLQQHQQIFLNYFDVILCVGSLPCGQQRQQLSQIVELLAPGGTLFIGELVLLRPPSRDFLEYLSISKEDYLSAEELSTHLLSLNLSLIHESYEDLEQYEATLSRNVEEWAEAHPNDEDAETILALSRGWSQFSSSVANQTWSFGTFLGRKNNL